MYCGSHTHLFRDCPNKAQPRRTFKEAAQEQEQAPPERLALPSTERLALPSTERLALPPSAPPVAAGWEAVWEPTIGQYFMRPAVVPTQIGMRKLRFEQ
uniref:WGS project CBMG000000000 data, contig CS5907-c002599 n=1 Tax=Fusarium acuminatum CS5907 TaxID=1318461 RepID=A0A090M9M0_9HYPO|nr:unnamed protein product [Fusarium acuminatum CS5907]